MRNYISALAILSTSVCSYAQTASQKVSGTIIDLQANETIVSAQIVAQDKTGNKVAYASSDDDGNYILNLMPGQYDITVNYMGYVSKQLNDVSVEAGKDKDQVNIALEETNTKELSEFVVTRSFKKESISSLYSNQKNAAFVSDGISAESFKKTPDRNSADVLKRISGITISDNKFAIIRGLSDRYNSALLDNASLPSTEANKKAFSFDIIPAVVIDKIVVLKSATPDVPADFAGGLIQIITKDIPLENFNNLSIGTGYNTASTFQQFKTGTKGGTDLLSFSTGRDLPKNFSNTSTLNSGNTSEEGRMSALKTLNNDYNITERKAMPAINLGASLGRVFQLNEDHKLGYFAALNYQHSESVKPNILRQYDDYNYTDQTYNYATTLGGVLNIGFSTPKSTLSWKTLYNRTADDDLLIRTGENYGRSSSIKYYAFDLIEKSLFKTTLAGTHNPNKNDQLTWLLSFNQVNNDQPDQKKISYGKLMDSELPYTADLGTVGKANNRLYSQLNESIFNAQVDYSTNIDLFQKTTLKAGLLGYYRTRDFTNRYLGATYANSQVPNSVRESSLDQIFSDENIDKGYFDLVDQTTSADEYSAAAATGAAYAMMDNKLTDKLRVIWGARFEGYQTDLSNATKQYVNTFWWDVLPSANLAYALDEKTNLRASYFKSLARPEFREMANLAYYDYALSANFMGNPLLQRTIIQNFDLKYERFFTSGELFSVGAFYKNFENPIEQRLSGGNSSYEITTVNFPSARNIGVEFELRKKLDFLGSEFLKNFTFYTNVALINSKMKLESVRYINDIESNSRPLAGQSPYMVNASLNFQSPNQKWGITASYNTFGQRLYLVGDKRFGDVYESSRNMLDFQAAYQLSKRSELKLNVKDLLNNPYRFYFDQDADGKFGGSAFQDGRILAKKDWILQQYRPGTNVSLSYSYKF